MQDLRNMSLTIAAESVAVAGTACTLPDRMDLDQVYPGRRRRQPSHPVHPDHHAAPRRQEQGMQGRARAAVLRLSALASLARAYAFGDADSDVLSHPEGEGPHLR